MVPTLWLLASGAAAQSLHPAGDEVDDAIVVQVSQAGLDELGGLVDTLVPPDPVDVPPVEDSGTCLIFWDYAYALTNAWVGVQLGAVNVTTSGPSHLDFAVDASVWVNDPGDQFNLHYELCDVSDGDCPGYVLPFDATVTLPVDIYLTSDATSGAPVWDVVLGDIVFTHSLQNEDITLGCGIQDVEDVLAFFGLSIYDLIIGFAEDFLVDELQAQAADIELQLEEALAAAQYSDTVDLAGVELAVDVLPRELRASGDGLQLDLATTFSAPPDPCVAEWDDGGSATTEGAAPAIASLQPNTEVGVHVADDGLNQALYAVWRGGLLCYEIAGGEVGGFAIDTTLLGLLGGAPYDALFPETQPLIVRTRPRVPPTVGWDGAHDVTIEVDDLDVDFYAEVDGRVARVLNTAVDADVGLDAVFDDLTGELAMELDLGTDVFELEASTVGMVDIDEAELSASLQSAIGTLVGSLVGSLVGDSLTFPLPSFEGLGLLDLDIHPSDDGTWGTVEAEVGPVDYGADGCSEGCSSDGATSGCAVGSGGAAGWLLVLGVVARRRRS